MNAFVLSGGGAKITFQAGAVRALYERGIFPDVIAGVSAGALTGSMLATGQYDKYYSLVSTAKNKDVYKHKMNVFWAVWALMRGKDYILDAAPLRNMINANLFGKIPQMPLYTGWVSMPEGFYSGESAELTANVYASAAMPLVFEPMLGMVDGGIRTNSPLGDVIKHDPEHIYIVNCAPQRIGAWNGKGLIDSAARVLEIMQNQILNDDLSQFIRINELVIQAKLMGHKLYKPDGTEYKAFKYTLIEPESKLGDMLDFDGNKEYLDLGYKRAVEALSQRPK